MYTKQSDAIIEGFIKKYTINYQPSNKQLQEYFNLIYVKSHKLFENGHIQSIQDVKHDLNIANVYTFDKQIYLSIGVVPTSSDGEFRRLFPYNENLNPEATKLAVKFYAKYKQYIVTNLNEKIVVMAITLNFYVSFLYANFTSNYIKQYQKYINLFKWKICNDQIKLAMRHNDYNIHKNLIGVLEVCNKIIPLTIDALKNTNSIYHGFWLEIYVMTIINKINKCFICDLLPYLFKWDIMKIKSPYVFSNSEIINKYTNSEFLLKNIGHLIGAKIKYEDKYTNIYNAKLNNALTFAEKNIIYSDYIGVMIMQHNGNSLVNHINIIKNLSLESLEIFKHFKNKNLFMVTCFQISYSLLVLNKHCKIIHGDLHLNNVTVRIINGESLYKLAGETYAVRIPIHHQIIDYGRCILAPEVLREIDPNDKELFDQHMNRLLDYFSKNMSEFYTKNQEHIREMAHSEPDKLFKILTLLDVYVFVKNLRIFILEYAEPEITEYAFKMDLFLQNLIKQSILGEGNQTFETSSKSPTETTTPTLDYPIHIFIKKFFPVLTDPLKSLKIVSINDFDQEIPDEKVKLDIKFLDKIKTEQLKQYDKNIKNI